MEASTEKLLLVLIWEKGTPKTELAAGEEKRLRRGGEGVCCWVCSTSEKCRLGRGSTKEDEEEVEEKEEGREENTDEDEEETTWAYVNGEESEGADEGGWLMEWKKDDNSEAGGGGMGAATGAWEGWRGTEARRSA